MDPRLNRQTWLDAGLTKLADEGPQSLTVMGIAQHLGVTKGSFYWHFSALDEYKADLLKEWESKNTQDLIEQTDGVSKDARTKLRFLLKTTLGQKSPLGGAIRAWALTDRNVAKLQGKVDKARLSYVAGLLHEMGWKVNDAQALARWLYYAVIGYFNAGGQVITERELDLYLALLDKTT